ncbi:hypothetical protein BDV40DRAFT_306042 [Aspergillus tamarii]|uniref:Uncharacterized protein n=1 Tax=Aspergillus tamarii TaxID=41984 RepID=A0A5N6UD15_ASPTM|nr:hypothetical protein BDV40DRAFT_306042 [Aspergillus tamarii]
MSTEQTTVATDATKEQYMAELFRVRHISYLQHILRQAAATRGQDMHSLSEYIQSQAVEINEVSRAKRLCESELQWERIAHAQTRQALEIEKKLRLEAMATLTRNHYDLLTYREAQSALQQTLDVERKRLEDMALQLEWTQKKFFLVDNLVDSMLLQEDSQLDVSDRSRQVTDIILDLENKMEAQYRAMLREKEGRIAQLECVLFEHGVSYVISSGEQRGTE